MKATSTISLASAVDLSCPWKLSKPRFTFPRYAYKMSVAQLNALFARAEQGDAEAEYEITVLYDDGCQDRSGNILVRRSARKMADWCRRSAEHGFAYAQTCLGVLLGDGRGIERNPREALVWLRKAYRQIPGIAATTIAITYRENGHLREAVNWLRKAAQTGDDDGAFVQLGVHYYWGKGVRTDHNVAVRCFRKAIKGKDITAADKDDAHFYLGVAYLEGKGVIRSLELARRHLERANIDSDHPPARRLLRQIQQKSVRNT